MSTREHLRIVAVIQARMGSTRLPGKVLKPVAGQPLLWHIIHRLKDSHLIEEIAVATTTNARDDAIVQFGQTHGVTVVRGPEDDVLSRFARAAETLDADFIVRVSSDAPFIDAGFVDHLIASMIEQGGDYVLLEEGAVTAHEGVDPMTRRALDKLMMDAHDDPVAREHVTGYFKLHPEFVPIARAKPFPPLAREGGRLTIDTPDDLAFVEAVHARMDARAGEASLADLLLLLEREPVLRTLNDHAAAEEARCRGRPRAHSLRWRRRGSDTVMSSGWLRWRGRCGTGEGIGSVFAVNGTEDALAPIRSAGFEAELTGADTAALQQALNTRKPDLLLLDCREGPSRPEVENLKKSVGLTAVIDDGSDRRLAADLAYYPPVPQAERLDWKGSHCVARVGWEWALLGLSQTTPRSKPASPRPTLLVAMGGSAILYGTYSSALRARACYASIPISPRPLCHRTGGWTIARRSPSTVAEALRSNFWKTIEGADDLAVEYASADFAIRRVRRHGLRASLSRSVCRRCISV